MFTSGVAVTMMLALLHVVQGQSYNLTGSSSYGIKGEDFRFICEIPGGSVLPFNLKFRKDGIEVCTVDPDDCKGSSLRQYKCGCINNNNKLYYMNISSINSSHQVTWTCTNFNPLNGSSNNIYLPVYRTPTITSIKSNTTNNQTTEGSRVVFSCSVDGLPLPTVTWSTSKGRQLSSNKEYNLPEVRCEDTDNYTCTASNNISSPVSTTVPLYVICSPREKSSPMTTVTSRINSMVTLEVDMIAYPKPEFTWIFDESNEILTDEVEELSIFNYKSYLKLKLTGCRFGNYTVVVDNSIGVGVSYTITVIEHTEEVDRNKLTCIVEGVGLTVVEGVGIGVGIGVILTPTVGAVVLFCLYRSGRIVFTTCTTNKAEDELRRQDNIEMCNISPTYEGLNEERLELEGDGYQQLHVYHNQQVK